MTGPPARGSVLVVDDEDQMRRLVSAQLRRAGYDVVLAGDGQEALARIAEATPDLVVSDVMMPVLDGLGLLQELRTQPATRGIPVILLTAKGALDDRLTGLDLGADDYLTKPFEMSEFLARVQAKIERPPVPSDELARDRRTSLLGERAFFAEAGREFYRAGRSGHSGWLAYLALRELPKLRERLGGRAEAELAGQVAGLLTAGDSRLEVVGRDSTGRFALLLPEIGAATVRRRLQSIVERIAGNEFSAGGEHLRLTPAIGYAVFADAQEIVVLRDRALAALDVAVSRADRTPVRFESSMAAAFARRAAAAAEERQRQWSLDPRAPLRIAARLGRALVHRRHDPVPDDPIAHVAPAQPSLGSVLVVDDEEQLRRLVSTQLQRAGYDVTVAADGQEALARIAEATPDVVVSDVMMPVLDGFGLVAKLRADEATRTIPVILLTARGSAEDRVIGFGHGADDYLTKPFAMADLLARVRVKIERPPVPSEHLRRDRRTNLLSERAFVDEVGREFTRAARSGRTGWLAYLALDELPVLRDRLSARAEAEIAKQAAGLLQFGASSLEVVGRDATGRFLLLLPETDLPTARRRLAAISERIVEHTFVAGGERFRLTPTIGYAAFAGAREMVDLRDRAQAALEVAAAHLDLQPVRYDPTMPTFAAARRTEAAKKAKARKRPFTASLRTPLQIALTLVLALLVPFAVYVNAYRGGFDLARGMYIVVVVALLLTAFLIWIEGFRALAPPDIPDEPGAPYPLATAIIAAYLPNEAATVVETVESFLRNDYPGRLQVILAYNTPRDLPIEAVLREIAARDERFFPLRIAHSTSKAQNVNAALAEARGDFIGVFDADHHPDPGSFERAWRWLSNGYDVVQGHCLIRNGAESWVARTVAVEFESIYAVAHPGRARLHRFGIFGGSNGYWHADLLRRIRMHGFMLTEDIDSSMRVIEAGGRIASDPGLISRELAPVAFKALWNQRMRWAQGWFQVSLKHLRHGLRSSQLDRRQKLGLFYLLGWREIYPWISMQMFPIIAYWVWRYGSLDSVDWMIPIFVLTTLFTLSAGPGQVLFSYLVGAPEIRQHRRWYLWYLLFAILFYTEVKNTIGRVAQVKEAMRERQWKVTPRAAAKEPGATP